MNADVAIIIPTANRPEFLRTALSSVSTQTAISRIAEVLVSENGGADASRAICAEFPRLPIRYLFRTPATSAMEHGKSLLGELSQRSLTAILHDDDWWAPHHLEDAVTALEDRIDVAAYYSSVFEVTGETSPLRCDHNLFFWFGSGYPPLTSIWNIGRPQATLSCLLMTPGRASALVTRTASLRSANVVLHNLGNPFDSDRMLTVLLSKEGKVLYNPLPQVFIRSHERQDQWSFPSEKRIEFMARTTDWIIESAEENPANLAQRFVEAVKRCPQNARPLLDYSLSQPWCIPRMALHPQMKSELRSLLQTMGPGSASNKYRTAVKQFIPPIVLSAKRMISRRFLHPQSP